MESITEIMNMLNQRIEQGICKVVSPGNQHYEWSEEAVAIDLTNSIYLPDRSFWEVDPVTYQNLRHFIANQRQAAINHSQKEDGVCFISLEESNDDEQNLHHKLPDHSSPNPEEEVLFNEKKEAILHAINELEEVDREIILGLFYKYETMETLAETFHLSCSSIHRHKEKSLQKLQNLLSGYAEEYEK